MSVLALLDFRRPTRGIDHAQFLDLVHSYLRRISRRFSSKGIVCCRQITDLNVGREIIHRILINSSTAVETPHVVPYNEFLPHPRTGIPKRLVQVQIRVQMQPRTALGVREPLHLRGASRMAPKSKKKRPTSSCVRYESHRQSEGTATLQNAEIARPRSRSN